MPTESLTEREFDVLELVARGARNREIARSLTVSIKTVEFHISNILSKLDAKSRTEAALHAWQADLLGFDRHEVQAERSHSHGGSKSLARQRTSDRKLSGRAT